jgi:hypothetical protein
MTKSHSSKKKILIYLRHSIFLPWTGDLIKVLSERYDIVVKYLPDIEQSGSAFWRRFSSTINFIEIAIHEEKNYLYALDWQKKVTWWAKIVLGLKKISPKISRGIVTVLIWIFRNTQRFRSPEEWAKGELDGSEGDLVIVMPANMPGSMESELIRVAMKREIPTLVPIMTLDNLTSKGIHLQIPKSVVVWNQIQSDILVTGHRISEKNITIIGSLFFDSWFRKAQDSKHVETDDKYDFRVLYVCSSSRIGNSRNTFAPRYTAEFSAIIKLIHDLELIAELHKQRMKLVIRQHPSNKLDPRIHEYSSQTLDIVISSGEFPNEDEDIENFTIQLCNTDLVVGLNTSAFLHASALGIPCLVSRLDGLEDVTTGTRHLKQLVHQGIVKIYSYSKLNNYVLDMEEYSNEVSLNFLGIEQTPVANRFLTLIESFID